MRGDRHGRRVWSGFDDSECRDPVSRGSGRGRISAGARGIRRRSTQRAETPPPAASTHTAVTRAGLGFADDSAVPPPPGDVSTTCLYAGPRRWFRGAPSPSLVTPLPRARCTTRRRNSKAGMTEIVDSVVLEHGCVQLAATATTRPHTAPRLAHPRDAYICLKWWVKLRLARSTSVRPLRWMSAVSFTPRTTWLIDPRLTIAERWTCTN